MSHVCMTKKQAVELAEARQHEGVEASAYSCDSCGAWHVKTKGETTHNKYEETNDIYLVTVEIVTPSKESSVLACTTEREDARVAYHRSRAQDYEKNSNCWRRTKMKTIKDAGTGNFDDDVEESVKDDAD